MDTQYYRKQKDRNGRNRKFFKVLRGHKSGNGSLKLEGIKKVFRQEFKFTLGLEMSRNPFGRQRRGVHPSLRT